MTELEQLRQMLAEREEELERMTIEGRSKLFMDFAKRKARSTGSSLSRAIAETKEEHPELFKAWTRQQKSQHRNAALTEEKKMKDFLEEARKQARESNCTMTQAMKEIARRDPEGFEAWKQAQQRQASAKIRR